MLNRYPRKLRELPGTRSRVHVFDDRAHAGIVLGDMLASRDRENALVLAVPAGGVPVARALTERLGLPLDVAVVSKITLPWNTEVGCGAVAFDGTVEMNEPLLQRAGLSEDELSERVRETKAKVARRQEVFRSGLGPLELRGRDAILVDDGLASGFTMLVAVQAVRKSGPRRVAVAVPTSPASTAGRLLADVDELWCANLRAGLQFAVADAYRHWRDVDEAEAAESFRQAIGRSGPEG